MDRTAVAMLVLCAACWGLSFPLVRAVALALQQGWGDGSALQHALWILAVRFGWSLALLAVAVPGALRQTTRREWEQGIGLGMWNALGFLFQTMGLQWIDASVSGFLTQLGVIFVPMLVFALRRTWPGGRLMMGCALALAGAAVLSGFDPSRLTMGAGEAATALGALFFSVQMLWLERPRFAGNRADRVTWTMFVTAGTVLGACALAATPDAGRAVEAMGGWRISGLMVVLAGIPTVASFLIMNAWQPRVAASQAGVIYCSESLFALGFALVLPQPLGWWLGIGYANEQLNATLLLGGGLIVAGTLLVSLPPARFGILNRARGRNTDQRA